MTDMRAVVDELAPSLLRDGISVRVAVTGSSMAPAIRTGDIVTIEPSAGFSASPGDVLVFPDADGHLRVHRFLFSQASQSGKPEEYLLRCGGDVSARLDSPVHPSDVLGRVVRIERANAAARHVARGRRLVRRSRIGLRMARAALHYTGARLMRRIRAAS